MPFQEHTIPKRRIVKAAKNLAPAPVRPSWMDTDLIDPDWMKANKVSAHRDGSAQVDVEDPTEIILGPIQERIKSVFHHSAVLDENGKVRNQ